MAASLRDLRAASERLAALCRQGKVVHTSSAEVQDFLRALEAAPAQQAADRDASAPESAEPAGRGGKED